MTADQYLIVRHGQTEWSATGRHTGRTDLELTTEGRVEAAGLSAMTLDLVGLSLDLTVYVSPRARARTTAELTLGRQAAANAVVTDLLAEYDYGDYEGLTTEQIQEREPGWDIFRDGCAGGESVSDVAKRCDEFIAMSESASGTVLAFTHGHLSRILTARLLGQPGEEGAVLLNDTASIGVVRDRRGTYVLQGWNLRPLGATRAHP
jgi:broad specificity phosphatase PhoE